MATDNSTSGAIGGLIDPIELGKIFWPDTLLYDKQVDVVYSVQDNDETYVPAGNMLGKDYVAAFIALTFFLTRQPCRVVTTSAKDDHLRVLWGEIGSFIQRSQYPLETKRGGILIVNHQDIRKLIDDDKIQGAMVKCPLSYMTGLVAGKDSIAAMAGHHIANTGDGVPRTLFIVDEASSVDDEYMRMARTWANRILVIGNTWPCENFFKHAIKGNPKTKMRGGDLPRPLLPSDPPTTKPGHRGYYRKVIKIRAEDSPNVRYALAQKEAGIPPTGEMLVPGVKSWPEYCKNLDTWDDIQKCVSLHADFWEGSDVMLFPHDWLERSKALAERIRRQGFKRQVKAIGIDPGEGVCNTCMVAVDEWGVIDMESQPTPDTSVVVNNAKMFMRKHGMTGTLCSAVCIDRGGGGKQHADNLRRAGFNVRTVAFGETVAFEPKLVGRRMLQERVDTHESRYAYRTRRSQMYGELSEMLDPKGDYEKGFAIPSHYYAIFEQLSPIPKVYDSEGRLELPPKDRRGPHDKRVTLIDLIGRSPDETDALVLAVYGMRHKAVRAKVGALFS